MGRIYDPKAADWKPIERRGAEEVTSHILVPLEEGGQTRLSLTRIAAGSTFGPHIDDYAHVFCVREGDGEVQIGKERKEIHAGDIITTEIGESHGLWAGPDADLVLVTANVYPA